VEFFNKLTKHNVREWFQANKQFYVDNVQGPMKLLAAALTPRFGPIKLFRPYRDVRFSADKKPIQEHASLATTGKDGIHFFKITKDEVLLAVGVYEPDAKQLEKFRQLLDSPAEAKKVRALIAELEGKGWTLSDSGKLTGAPKGYKKDHPEIDLLRYKSLAVRYSEPMGKPWFKPACLNKVVDSWAYADEKWFTFLREKVL